MASILEQLQVKYKTREVEKNNQYLITTITYQGSLLLCVDYMNTHKVGQVSIEYGSLDDLKMTQDVGPFWNVTTVWKKDISGEEEVAADDNFGPTKSTLSMSAMSMPVESHKNYEMIWNNNFYSTKAISQMSDAEKTVANGFISTSKGHSPDGSLINTITDAYTYDPAVVTIDWTHPYFCFAKSENECPSLRDNHRWFIYKWMTKPGVDSFTYPTYTLTERSKNNTKEKAGWMMTKKAGKISHPLYSDFGITEMLSGNWLCEGGSIEYDGNYWITTRNFTHSPDILDGWDPQLYERE